MSENENLIFYKAMRNARIAKKLSRTELADKLGVSDARVRQLEVNSYGGMTEGLFLRIAEALELTPVQLLEFAYKEGE